ncbi:MAG: PCYCGC motif-containing (lipo)protein, partial [Thermoanaerobaculia bacterium]
GQTLAAVALAAFAALALGADKSFSNAPKKKATPAPAAAAAPATNSCKSCVERRPILDPALFADTRIYDLQVRPSYEAARKIPATIDRLHCFCECAESTQFRHKTLLTCFTDNHAAGCGICIREALLAWDLKGKDASDDEVVRMVESMFKTDGHPPTHGSR